MTRGKALQAYSGLVWLAFEPRLGFFFPQLCQKSDVVFCNKNRSKE